MPTATGGEAPASAQECTSVGLGARLVRLDGNAITTVADLQLSGPIPSPPPQDIDTATIIYGEDIRPGTYLVIHAGVDILDIARLTFLEELPVAARKGYPTEAEEEKEAKAVALAGRKGTPTETGEEEKGVVATPHQEKNMEKLEEKNKEAERLGMEEREEEEGNERLREEKPWHNQLWGETVREEKNWHNQLWGESVEEEDHWHNQLWGKTVREGKHWHNQLWGKSLQEEEHWHSQLRGKSLREEEHWHNQLWGERLPKKKHCHHQLSLRLWPGFSRAVLVLHCKFTPYKFFLRKAVEVSAVNILGRR